MATPECIESPSTTFVADQAEMPICESASLETRMLKVSVARQTWKTKRVMRKLPKVRLEGRWLERAGFLPGDPVKITVDRGRLVVELATPEDLNVRRNRLLTSLAERAARSVPNFSWDWVHESIPRLLSPDTGPNNAPELKDATQA